jgi:hypothetical protein
MDWGFSLGSLCPWCSEHAVLFDPRDWVAWFQIVAAIVAIVFAFYQFNKLRESSQKKLDDYAKRHLDSRRRELGKERTETLALIESDQFLSPFRRWFRRFGSNCKRLYRGVIGWLPIEQEDQLAEAMLLFNGGAKERAAQCFKSLSSSLLDEVKVYEDQAKLKRVQSANALIYAGRVLALSGDVQGTRDAFQHVLDKIDEADLDAIELIGQQYRDTNNLEAALHQSKILERKAQEKGEQGWVARAYRLQASIHIREPRRNFARAALSRSRDIEALRSHDNGLGATQELFGDLYESSQPPNKLRALQHFTSAQQYCQTDGISVERLQKKIDRAQGKAVYRQTLGSRVLLWIGSSMIGASTKLRAPVHMT